MTKDEAEAESDIKNSDWGAYKFCAWDKERPCDASCPKLKLSEPFNNHMATKTSWEVSTLKCERTA